MHADSSNHAVQIDNILTIHHPHVVTATGNGVVDDEVDDPVGGLIQLSYLVDHQL